MSVHSDRLRRGRRCRGACVVRPREDGVMAPAELGKHGTSVNTYPPTQVGKDGKVDADSGHDATQD